MPLSSWSRLGFALPLALFALAPACGGSEAAVGSTASDAAPGDARIEASDPVVTDAGSRANAAPLSCDAGVTTTSDGGACDGSRLRVQSRAANMGCFAVGQFCDMIFFSVPAADRDKLPQGFSCGIELGVATCQYPVTNHTVDAATLDALCAALATFPDGDANCIILD